MQGEVWRNVLRSVVSCGEWGRRVMHWVVHWCKVIQFNNVVQCDAPYRTEVHVLLDFLALYSCNSFECILSMEYIFKHNASCWTSSHVEEHQCFDSFHPCNTITCFLQMFRYLYAVFLWYRSQKYMYEFCFQIYLCPCCIQYLIYTSVKLAQSDPCWCVNFLQIIKTLLPYYR